LDIGTSGNREIIPMLEEIHTRRPRSVNPFDEDYPELKIKRSYSPHGVAEVALIQLGDEELKSKLISESLHEDKLVRSNALRKAKMLEGDIAVEMLSYFIGDLADEMKKPTGWLEQLATIELSDRLADPPYEVDIDDIESLRGYRKGREAWLKWRYENYGPIPGREAMFAQFENSEAPSIDADGRPEDAAAEASGSGGGLTPATEPGSGPSTKDSNPWPWLGGLFALVVAGGLAAVFIRHGRR